ncbi:hypothetical protein LTR78_010791 [Recurvomyces mirabilis]|uniref:AB hydrolase-1 domain-containing protein n=1 Tax=Recurvomyces mirabilis TaxID=574656 RepID=A0AAE0TLZ2_9PEZI|nr:hypothetical protein LTR78_010791 [Recurvomyces mirabilis]KAK5149511.1 hypothetical protein LTS14_010877 [Recurvomyces mirabilis]
MAPFLFLLATLSLTTTLVNAYAPRPDCHPFFLDIPIEATSLDLDIIHVDNNIDAVDFAVDFDRWDAPNITSRISSSSNVSETFTIYAELCSPPGNGTVVKKDAIQILTHGAVFDHRYWDVDLKRSEYSYVQAALNAGYTVLNYDRLCNGLSDKPDAYTLGHGLNELQILRVLTEIVRAGTLNSHLHSGSTLPSTPAFDKVVHVGHSSGSQLTTALLTSYGNLSDAAILTGLLFADHLLPTATLALGFTFAPENNPVLFGGYPSGYIVPSDVGRIQAGFFHRVNDTDPAGFTDEALAYAESVKSPLATGEWLSLRGLLNVGPSAEFKGAVEFFAAEFDELVCDGDCRNDYDPAVLQVVYPHAEAVEVYLQPGAGHGLTLHRNASGGYGVMLDFLGKHGL